MAAYQASIISSNSKYEIHHKSLNSNPISITALFAVLNIKFIKSVRKITVDILFIESQNIAFISKNISKIRTKNFNPVSFHQRLV